MKKTVEGVALVASYAMSSKSQKGHKLLKAKAAKHVAEKREKSWPTPYRSNMVGIIKLISELKLKNAHIDGLKKTPFWFLFDALLEKKLTCHQCRKSDKLVVKIIEAYDSEERNFRLGGQIAELTKNDIKLIFGISCGDEPIDLTYGNKDAVGMVKRRSIKHKRLTVPVIKELLVAIVEGEEEEDIEDVVRLLCLYLCHTFFFSPGTTVKWVYLEKMEDLEQMRKYDWCGAIRKTLMMSINTNHRQPRSVSGCVMALLYWLCEHTTIVKSQNPEAFPRFLKWNIPNLHRTTRGISLQTLDPCQVDVAELTVTKRESEIYYGEVDDVEQVTDTESEDEEWEQDEEDGDNESDFETEEGPEENVNIESRMKPKHETPRGILQIHNDGNEINLDDDLQELNSGVVETYELAKSNDSATKICDELDDRGKQHHTHRILSTTSEGPSQYEETFLQILCDATVKDADNGFNPEKRHVLQRVRQEQNEEAEMGNKFAQEKVELEKDNANVILSQTQEHGDIETENEKKTFQILELHDQVSQMNETMMQMQQHILDLVEKGRRQENEHRMSPLSEQETCISDSELEESTEKSYEELFNECVNVEVSDIAHKSDGISSTMDTTEPFKGKDAKETFSVKLPILVPSLLEVRKMKKNVSSQLKTIFKEHEKIATQLEAQREELKRREKELEKREAQNEKERRQLYSEKKLRETLEQKKADEDILRLVEEQKREKEELHRRITGLELEVDYLRGALQYVRHKCEDGEVEFKKKMDAMQKDLKDKEQDLEDQDCLIQALTVKERKSNDELQETRKELINGLTDNHASIGVKRMGELDNTPFHTAVKRKYAGEAAEDKATELCSLWEGYLRDSNWHPFKVIPVAGGYKEMIDEEDEKLNSLKGEFGSEVYEAVTTALTEINQCNPSGRCPLPELWNFNEQRKATLDEGVSYVLKQCNLHKRRRN